jgi:hypothetical protein
MSRLTEIPKKGGPNPTYRALPLPLYQILRQPTIGNAGPACGQSEGRKAQQRYFATTGYTNLLPSRAFMAKIK